MDGRRNLETVGTGCAQVPSFYPPAFSPTYPHIVCAIPILPLSLLPSRMHPTLCESLN